MFRPVPESLIVVRALWRDMRAVTAVEFALVAPLLLALIIATAEVGLIFVAKAYLETGAEQAARLVLTNQAVTTANGQTSPMTQAQFTTAVCGQLPALFTCANLIVQLEPLPASATSVSSLLPQFNADGTLANPVAYATGSAGQNMLLAVIYEWPLLSGPLGMNFGTLGNGTLLMSSTQIFRIEN